MEKNRKVSGFTEELADSISSIQRLARAMLKKRSDVLIQGIVTMPQYLVLEFLVREGTVKMKDIAKYTHSSFPAASGLVDRLVSLGLVKRTYDKEDRRVIFIELTPKGKKIAVTTMDTRKEIIEDIFSCLSDAEKKTYLSIITKVKRNLHEKSQQD